MSVRERRDYEFKGAEGETDTKDKHNKKQIPLDLFTLSVR